MTMEFTPLSISGAMVMDSPVWGDERGFFREWFKLNELRDAGFDFSAAQANLSHSARNVVRGLHYSVAPIGQAKAVTCVLGSLVDGLVDILDGSPTFGAVEYVELSANAGRTVLIPSGVGHGFCATSDLAGLAYLLTSSYDPTQELEVHPLDPALALNWPLTGEPVLSAKDAAAPTLAQRRASGGLATFRA